MALMGFENYEDLNEAHGDCVDSALKTANKGNSPFGSGLDQ